MTNTSVTIRDTGIPEVITDGHMNRCAKTAPDTCAGRPVPPSHRWGGGALADRNP
jgi:hypothetical protein